MEIEFPIGCGKVIAWWQAASEKRSDCKIFGSLCDQIRCRQHSFGVMWSLRESTMAGFYENHKGEFKEGKSWVNLCTGVLRVEVLFWGTTLGLPLSWQSHFKPHNLNFAVGIPIAHQYVGSTEKVHYGKLLWCGGRRKKEFQTEYCRLLLEPIHLLE